ncbi:MAG: hypothetical protein AAGJ35_01075 [Myxococcota bacterium]
MATESIESWENRWRRAVLEEDVEEVELCVRTILHEHPETAVAAEIRFQRGVIALEEGEGTGQDRLERARVEFGLGFASGQAVGEAAEPWRSINRNQWALCTHRLGDPQQAQDALLEVSRLRPRSLVGWEALRLLCEISAEIATPDAEKLYKRYFSQRLSYLRALVREQSQAETEQWNQLRFLLAMELCDRPRFVEEGVALLETLRTEGQAKLGEELYADVVQLAAEMSSVDEV